MSIRSSIPGVYIEIKQEKISPLIPSGGVLGFVHIIDDKIFEIDPIKEPIGANSFNELREEIENRIGEFFKSDENIDKFMKIVPYIKGIQDKEKNDLKKLYEDYKKLKDKEKKEKIIKRGAEIIKSFNEEINIIQNAFNNGLYKLIYVRSKKEEKDKKIILEGLDILETYPEVELVTIAPYDDRRLFDLLAGHIKKCEEEAKGRIGFIPYDEKEDRKCKGIVKVFPKEALGGVIGKLSNIEYYESGTFKNLIISSEVKTRYRKSEIEKLIDKGVLCVARMLDKGDVIVKDIMSDKSPISVQRIVNYIVRNINGISYNYIGELNTEDVRDALKEKIIEFLQGLQRDNIIVPIIKDGKKEPAFMVEVSCTPREFSQGIVRVELLVRPVRAIYYIDIRLNIRAT